jgi:hypothetical protein
MKSPLIKSLRKQKPINEKATRACELAKHNIYDR